MIEVDQPIWIRGTDWIGDAVMSVPALREVRRLHPRSPIILIVRSWVSGLYQGQNLAQRIVVLPDDEGALAGLARLRQEMRTARHTILFKNAFSAALAAWWAGVPERVGYATDARRYLLTRLAVPRIQERGLHQVFYYLDLLYQTGVSTIDYISSNFEVEIRLEASREGLAEARELLAEHRIRPDRPLVVINPGAFFGSAKRWFADRYAQVADLVIENLGAEVVIIGSASERRIADEIAHLMKARPHILSGRPSLPGLMGLLTESDLLLTNDSGPMHLAAALDVPQIALFGSTDEQATGPLGRNSLVVHRHVECSPCLLRECPLDLRCFRAIQVEEVFAAAKTILIERNGGRRNRRAPLRS